MAGGSGRRAKRGEEVVPESPSECVANGHQSFALILRPSFGAQISTVHMMVNG